MGRRLSELWARDSERERDIEESEDRQMVALAALKAEVNAFEAQVNARLDRMDARLDRVEQHLIELDSSMTASTSNIIDVIVSVRGLVQTHLRTHGIDV